MAKLTKDGKLLIENVLLSFPHLTEKSDRTGKFGAAFLIEKDSENAKAISAQIEKCAREGFGTRAEKVLAAMKRTDKFPLKDGDNKEEMAGYAGRLFINANSNVQPKCFGPSCKELSEKEMAELLYAGARVNAIIAFFKYSHSTGGEGVGVGLQGVQFVEHSDRFGGGATAKAEDFPVLAENTEETGFEAQPWE